MLHELVVIWLPTVVAAVAVFIVSSIIHMATPWHKGDAEALPNEDAVANLLRDLPGGEYRFPFARSMDEMKSDAFREKVKRGPMGVIGISGPNREKGMQRALLWWFLYCLIVVWFSGHIAHVVLGSNPDAHDVIHTVGLVAFMGFGFALAQASIWGPRKWWVTTKSLIDALIFGAVTGFVFHWLWPR